LQIRKDETFPELKPHEEDGSEYLGDVVRERIMKQGEYDSAW